MKAWMYWTGLALLGLVLASLIAVVRVEAANPPHPTASEKYTCDKERIYLDDDGNEQVEYVTGKIDFQGDTVKGEKYLFEASSDQGELTLEVFLGNHRIATVDSTLVETPDGTTNLAEFSFTEGHDNGSYSVVVISDRRIKCKVSMTGSPPQLDP